MKLQKKLHMELDMGPCMELHKVLHSAYGAPYVGRDEASFGTPYGPPYGVSYGATNGAPKKLNMELPFGTQCWADRETWIVHIGLFRGGEERHVCTA